MYHLRNLGNEINIRINPDRNGYVGRECPNKQCLGYFKITLGTGLTVPAPCHCPYCGHSGPSNTFFTPDQLAYAKSVATRAIIDAVQADLKSLEFDHKPSGPFGIGISMKLEPSAPRPIHYYREQQLETEIVCDKCTLRYAIYGVFGWCPDCGVHNSLQILSKNLDLAKKELALAATAEADLAAHLIGDALRMSWRPLTGSAGRFARRSRPASSFRIWSRPDARSRRRSRLILPMLWNSMSGNLPAASFKNAICWRIRWVSSTTST
jgi:hypothetical protein